MMRGSDGDSRVWITVYRTRSSGFRARGCGVSSKPGGSWAGWVVGVVGWRGVGSGTGGSSTKPLVRSPTKRCAVSSTGDARRTCMGRPSGMIREAAAVLGPAIAAAGALCRLTGPWEMDSTSSFSRLAGAFEGSGKASPWPESNEVGRLRDVLSIWLLS